MLHSRVNSHTNLGYTKHIQRRRHRGRHYAIAATAPLSRLPPPHNPEVAAAAAAAPAPATTSNFVTAAVHIMKLLYAEVLKLTLQNFKPETENQLGTQHLQSFLSVQQTSTWQAEPDLVLEKYNLAVQRRPVRRGPNGTEVLGKTRQFQQVQDLIVTHPSEQTSRTEDESGLTLGLGDKVILSWSNS